LYTLPDAPMCAGKQFGADPGNIPKGFLEFFFEPLDQRFQPPLYILATDRAIRLFDAVQ